MKPTEEKIVIALLKAEDHWLSRSDVGRAVGLKRTPYLSGMLDDLVERGVIKRELGSWGGFACWFYGAEKAVVQQFITFPIDEWIAAVKHEEQQD